MTDLEGRVLEEPEERRGPEFSCSKKSEREKDSALISSACSSGLHLGNRIYSRYGVCDGGGDGYVHVTDQRGARSASVT